MEQWVFSEVKKRFDKLMDDPKKLAEIREFVDGMTPFMNGLSQLQTQALILETMRREEQDLEKRKQIEVALKETLEQIEVAREEHNSDRTR